MLIFANSAADHPSHPSHTSHPGLLKWIRPSPWNGIHVVINGDYWWLMVINGDCSSLLILDDFSDLAFVPGHIYHLVI